MLGRASVNTTSFKDWTPLVKTAVVAKVKKVKPPPKEVYPHFLVYASYYEHDLEWKEILRKCTYDKFPPGFRYRDYVISYRKPSKTLSYKIMDLTKATADAIVDFMRVSGTIYSKQDQFRTVDTGVSEEIVLRWETCKTNVRSSLLQKFCCYCMVTFRLTTTQRDELFSVLMIGLSIGNITAEDVIIDKNEIVSIRSVVYENGVFYCGGIRPIK
jgi:hypothetical protein